MHVANYDICSRALSDFLGLPRRDEVWHHKCAGQRQYAGTSCWENMVPWVGEVAGAASVSRVMKKSSDYKHLDLNIPPFGEDACLKINQILSPCNIANILRL